MLNIPQMIREAVQALELRLGQRLANLIQQTKFTNPTPDGEEDGTAGLPESGGSYQRTPRRWQHFGFRSVPPNDAGAIMLQVGGGSASIVTIAEDGKGYGPTLAKGEAALFSDGAAKVVATGSDVTVNGGTKKVARDTDPVVVTGGSYTAASLTLQIKDGAGSTGTLVVTVAAGVLVVTPVGVLAASTFTLAGTINGGATNFKG